ncbi:GNAT family N-acetyltransferase [Wenxinia marina]|uniref:Acetyltransferase n=1 Tax=Wenxinia marina DSM 24838 TaxID=1123501 RepID=A0A0D0Q6Z0_9RHOB|nr:GNAT family N-acetyltransferase [Wenxinia marina]KIQ70174.1 Acetyltransferase [Wenxinia marina DSM 24838]GGL50838.1 GNAT family N-acetyltransferase [Wenxinia marina]
MSYRFRPATPADLPLLRRWIAAPHVAEWWDAEDPCDESDLADPSVRRWIVEPGGAPFAYAQDYDPHAEPGHHFADLPRGARGIDQFIGEAAMTGRGHGTAFLRQRVAELFAEGAPAIGTDPHPDNARAIAVYRKVGFVAYGAPLVAPWGLVQPMVARRGA